MSSSNEGLRILERWAVSKSLLKSISLTSPEGEMPIPLGVTLEISQLKLKPRKVLWFFAGRDTCTLGLQDVELIAASEGLAVELRFPSGARLLLTEERKV